MYLILIGVSIALLGGFFALVAFERGRGLRVAGAVRNRLDTKVARATFIATHVDWGAFVRHLAGTAFERVLHDVAHGVLRLVRITERMLTRMVKALRERRGMPIGEDEGEGTVTPFQARVERVRDALKRARAASRKPARRRPQEPRV